MNILLDTCTFLWIITDDEHLTELGRSLFSDPENEIFLSSASSWEIAIKNSLGKLLLPEHPVIYIPEQRTKHGIQELPITEEAVLHLLKLPSLHKDPFDRILVCQSILTGLPLLTPDSLIQQYPVKTIWK